MPVLGTASSLHGGKSVDGIAGANSGHISTELSQVTVELPRSVFRAIAIHDPLLTLESIDVSRKNQMLVFISATVKHKDRVNRTFCCIQHRCVPYMPTFYRMHMIPTLLI